MMIKDSTQFCNIQTLGDNQDIEVTLLCIFKKLVIKWKFIFLSEEEGKKVPRVE